MPLPSQMDRAAELGRPFVSRGSRRVKQQAALVAGAAGVAVLIAALVYGVGKMLPARGGEENPRALASRFPSAERPGGPVGGAMPDAQPERAVTLRQGAAADPGAGQPPARPQPVDVTNPRGPAAAPPKVSPTQPAPATPSGSPTLAPSGSSGEARALMEAGERAYAARDLVEARRLLSLALLHPQTAKGDQEALRTRLTAISEELLFSTKIDAADPLVEAYTVAAGDSPVKIWRKRQLATDYRLIAKINRIDPRRLSVGQKLKLVRGPFHVVVHKADHRLDLFAGSPDEPESWLYIKSFRVGLGANDGTPIGDFVVKKGSKLVNPPWTNPKTGEKFAADDPKNPIGEHWIGIEGVGASAVHTGFGLHGTVEPDSIGKDMSMGCVRMGSEDIELMFGLLVEQISVVRIVPE